MNWAQLFQTLRILRDRGLIIATDAVFMTVMTFVIEFMSSWGFGDLGPVPFYVVCLMCALGINVFYIYQTGPRWMSVGMLVGAIFISLSGASDVMYWVSPLVGGAMTTLAFGLIGAMLAGGTFFGFGVGAVFSEDTFDDTISNSKTVFQQIQVMAFMTTLTGMAMLFVAPILPYQWTLGGLALVLLLVSSALATLGTEAAFKFFSAADRVLFIGFVVVAALIGFGILKPEFVREQIKTLAWEATVLEKHYLPWLIILTLTIAAKVSINNWTDITWAKRVDALCGMIFTSMVAAVIAWLFWHQALKRAFNKYLKPRTTFAWKLEQLGLLNFDQLLAAGLFIITMLLIILKPWSWGRVIFTILVLWGGAFGFEFLFFRLR